MAVGVLARGTAMALVALMAAGTVEALAARPGQPARGHPDALVRQARLGALRSRWPVQGRINSDFGAPRSAWRSRSHRGVDIGARPGTPVRAPLGGAVAFAGWRSGYGKTVILDHGGEVRTLYGHLSRVGVRRGQRVEAGAPIGLTGATGNASGPHLHYEMLVRGRSVNPRDAVSRGAGPRRADAQARAPARRGGPARSGGVSPSPS